MRMTPQASYSVIVHNSRLIFDDAKFFLRRSGRKGLSRATSNRYARTSIVFMAFYFESFANLVLDELRIEKKKAEEIDRHTDLSRPIRWVRAAYQQRFQVELPVEIDGIKDLFLVRNKIMAHPSGRAIAAGSGVPTGRGLDFGHRDYNFYKLKSLPNVYSGYEYRHAKDLYKELLSFMTALRKAWEEKSPRDRIFRAFPDLNPDTKR